MAFPFADEKTRGVAPLASWALGTPMTGVIVMLRPAYPVALSLPVTENAMVLEVPGFVVLVLI